MHMSQPTAPDYSPEDFRDYAQDYGQDYTDLDDALEDYREARGQWGDDPVTYSALPCDLPDDPATDEMSRVPPHRMTFLHRCFGKHMSFASIMERYS